MGELIYGNETMTINWTDDKGVKYELTPPFPYGINPSMLYRTLKDVTAFKILDKNMLRTVIRKDTLISFCKKAYYDGQLMGILYPYFSGTEWFLYCTDGNEEWYIPFKNINICNQRVLTPSDKKTLLAVISKNKFVEENLPIDKVNQLDYKISDLKEDLKDKTVFYSRFNIINILFVLSALITLFCFKGFSWYLIGIFFVGVLISVCLTFMRYSVKELYDIKIKTYIDRREKIFKDNDFMFLLYKYNTYGNNR